MNNTDKQLVALLQDLIRIPSWVATEPELRSIHNENQVINYLENWLKQNTDMEVERQLLEGGRYNLIARKGEPDLVFLAHTDTVQPSEDAPYNQLAAEIHNGKIWGRGAADMKSGIAAMIQALALSPDFNNIWLFLYADEEYDFLGMKSLVEVFGNIRPKLIVSSDGSDLHLGHGCRGLIEFRGRFLGQTGHPARGSGKSATMLGWETLTELHNFCDEYQHPTMGRSSFNVAHVLGGAKQPDSFDDRGYLIKAGQAGNVVSDIMEFVLDIRPASPDLSIELLISKLEEIAHSKDLRFEVVHQTHKLGAWFTELSDIDQFIEVNQFEVDNPGVSGYIDLQMLWEATGRPPAFMFGGGAGETAHTPNEHIEIADLIKTRDFFINLLENDLS